MNKQNVSRYGSVVMLVAAALLLFLAQSAYWVNHTVFNQKNFTQITTTTLLSQSSRDAVATTIVDKALQDRPVLQRTIGDRAVKLTSSLLGSDLSSQALTTLTSKTYAYITSSDRQDIKIELEGVKTPISKVVALVQEDDSEQPILEKIPDEIVLVRSSDYPDLSGTVQLMLWLGPLFWLSSITLFALYIYIGRAIYAKRVYLVGLTIIIVSVFGILTAPVIPPPISAAIPNISLRPVAEDLMVGFLAPFKTQMYYMLGYTLVVLAIFNQRFNILSGIRSLEHKIGTQTHKTPAKKPSKKT